MATDQYTSVSLFAGAQTLLEAVNHVLIASEDGGDMNDIDWDFLRSAVKGAENGTSVEVIKIEKMLYWLNEALESFDEEDQKTVENVIDEGTQLIVDALKEGGR